METIEGVKKQIELNTELLSETKKRIQTTATKLSDAKSNVGKIEAEITSLREKRQAALVKGGDVKGQSGALKKLEAEQELESETITGIETFLKELQQEEANLHLTINALPKRILQLRSLELAGEYNTLAEKLAPTIEELNEIYYKLSGNGNNKENLVAFYPQEGVFEKLPKIFFDPDGLNLESYVAKNPGKYHENIMLAESEKCFYSWPLHQNKLRA